MAFCAPAVVPQAADGVNGTGVTLGCRSKVTTAQITLGQVPKQRCHPDPCHQRQDRRLRDGDVSCAEACQLLGILSSGRNCRIAHRRHVGSSCSLLPGKLCETCNMQHHAFCRECLDLARVDDEGFVLLDMEKLGRLGQCKDNAIILKFGKPQASVAQSNPWCPWCQ